MEVQQLMIKFKPKWSKSDQNFFGFGTTTKSSINLQHICVCVPFSVQISMSLKFQQQNFTLTNWQYVQHFCGSRGNLENERWILYFLFIRLEVKCMKKKNWAVVRY